MFSLASRSFKPVVPLIDKTARCPNTPKTCHGDGPQCTWRQRAWPCCLFSRSGFLLYLVVLLPSLEPLVCHPLALQASPKSLFCIVCIHTSFRFPIYTRYAKGRTYRSRFFHPLAFIRSSGTLFACIRRSSPGVTWTDLAIWNTRPSTFTVLENPLRPLGVHPRSHVSIPSLTSP
jgi:hypothetical protein